MDNKISSAKRSKEFNNSGKQCVNSKKKTAQRALQFVLDWVLIMFL